MPIFRGRSSFGLSGALVCLAALGVINQAGCGAPKGDGASLAADAPSKTLSPQAGSSADAAIAQPGEAAGRSIAAIEQHVRERIETLRERSGAPGATFGCVLADGRSIAVASGISNKTSRRPMEPDDRMLAGSIGKTYVAAIALKLYEEDRLDLDSRISRWLADEAWFARLPNSADITLRMLLNHTSGLPDHIWMPDFIDAIDAKPQKVWEPSELIAFVLREEPLFAAGSGWSYTDTNYILVGMILERVTGRPYYEELSARLLVPLGLEDTIPADRPELPGLVSGYTTQANPFPVPDEVTTDGRCAFNPQMEWTGGGLLSTSLDLARWAREVYGGSVLTTATRTQMLQGVTATRLGSRHSYGLGVTIRPSRNGPVYGHSGWFPGYISMMAYYADDGLAMAIQVNTDTGVPSAVLERFLDDLASWMVATPSAQTGSGLQSRCYWGTAGRAGNRNVAGTHVLAGCGSCASL